MTSCPNHTGGLNGANVTKLDIAPGGHLTPHRPRTGTVSLVDGAIAGSTELLQAILQNALVGKSPCFFTCEYLGVIFGSPPAALHL